MNSISIRHATSADHLEIVRLAALDSAPIPFRPALVAEDEGEIVAALSLRGGGPVADPFRPTAAAVQLLELRARQLSVEDRPRPVSRVRLVLRRLAPVP